MKTTNKIYGITLVLAYGLTATALNAQNLLYVANVANNTIGEYTTAGAAINASPITGLNQPYGLTISGTNLFVANSGTASLANTRYPAERSMHR